MGSKSLYQSVFNQSYRDIKFWLEVQKVWINTSTKATGNTAMHAAAKLQNPEFARYIHERGGSLCIYNYDGYTPLLISIEAKCIETSKFLIKSS